MAGQGPAPKPAGRRARRNADAIPQTVLEFRRAPQPILPVFGPGGEPWPDPTVTWWATWGASAQAELMTATDWSFLLDTALLHARLWAGEVSVAPELRLRVAKFGATLEDRARLRIVFADADDADGGKGAAPAAQAAKERFGNVRLLRKPKTDGDGDQGDADAVAGA
ncbi:hypothetical protein AB0I61_17290 [Polymorphospora rubra]|uniref:phage terminase small subunit n=1 Tax=Polymorphospora rubra TaxID=338584 RepID=UPI0033FD0C61